MCILTDKELQFRRVADQWEFWNSFSLGGVDTVIIFKRQAGEVSLARSCLAMMFSIHCFVVASSHKFVSCRQAKFASKWCQYIVNFTLYTISGLQGALSSHKVLLW
jgi:hypothetical protein